MSDGRKNRSSQKYGRVGTTELGVWRARPFENNFEFRVNFVALGNGACKREQFKILCVKRLAQVQGA
jgi:hypothetical protein